MDRLQTRTAPNIFQPSGVYDGKNNTETYPCLIDHRALDLNSLDAGNYEGAIKSSNSAAAITSVLYPNHNTSCENLARQCWATRFDLTGLDTPQIQYEEVYTLVREFEAVQELGVKESLELSRALLATLPTQRDQLGRRSPLTYCSGSQVEENFNFSLVNDGNHCNGLDDYGIVRCFRNSYHQNCSGDTSSRCGN
ncbi:glycosyltransferase family 35 protein [Athelia psychrophila]|uniref:Glycosyltransferase family 35 protein n=1 Tax=Athelia psychrophila TaxID=1759441 RepID=A0A166QS11_9AGAM|nr:glycosyltransferase family 35 protein [Fibularhizoctonia sp. CBS 109695]